MNATLKNSLPSFDNSVLGIVPQPGRLDELHLYHGSHCNRACAFCCVNGEPEGHHTPFDLATLRAAVDIVSQKGSLKIYGGEPTLDAANLKWMTQTLRDLDFEGAITIFSNGLRERVLIDLMEADKNLFVVLNYAIATGRGESPLPTAVAKQLNAFHEKHPGRLFLSHEFVVAVGRQGDSPGDSGPCFRCHPTLTSKGEFHACPFAVEYDRAHFHLGDATTSSEQVQRNFSHFLKWVDFELDPLALQRGESSCKVCTGNSPPDF